MLCYKPQTEPNKSLAHHPFEPSYALVVDETLTIQSKACCEFVVNETLTIQSKACYEFVVNGNPDHQFEILLRLT